jgi:hypothetical protein
LKSVRAAAIVLNSKERSKPSFAINAPIKKRPSFSWTEFGIN